MARERTAGQVVDLLSRRGMGPLWGMASADLNATLLAWPPGHEVAAHTNSELDVLLIMLDCKPSHSGVIGRGMCKALSRGLFLGLLGFRAGKVSDVRRSP
jgi:hypothetical protein